MTKKEALINLRWMLFGLQKYRSVMFEETGKTEDELADIQKWAFGKQSILRIMSQAVTSSETTGILLPEVYYNFITIFTSFMPEVMMVVNGEMILAGLDPIDANISLELIANGWDGDEK